MKAVIILRNGTEIAIQTESLRVERTWRGKVKSVCMDNPQGFVRYMDEKEIACILSYPNDKEDTNDGKKAD